MLKAFTAVLFGCTHKNFSFPQRIRGVEHRMRIGAPIGVDDYVVCTDCGKELPYSWRDMRVVSPVHFPQQKLEEIPDDCCCMVR